MQSGQQGRSVVEYHRELAHRDPFCWVCGLLGLFLGLGCHYVPRKVYCILFCVAVFYFPASASGEGGGIGRL